MMFYHVDEVRLYLWTAATNGIIVHPPDHINTKIRWSDTDREKPKDSEKKCVPVPPCPPQILTWTDLRGERPATNILNHETALLWCYTQQRTIQDDWLLDGRPGSTLSRARIVVATASLLHNTSSSCTEGKETRASGCPPSSIYSLGIECLELYPNDPSMPSWNNAYL
jgi:hypothetical protein